MSVIEEIEGAPAQMTGKRLGNARMVPRLGVASFEPVPPDVASQVVVGGTPEVLHLRRRSQRDGVHFKGH